MHSFAGSDSTASTMQSFLHHILREPRIYQQIMAEIDDAVKAGRLSEVVQFNEAIQLPYFQAALKEAMRMRPAVGVAMARQVPPAGADIDGKWYPGGTAIDVHAWVLHRDRGVFGDDAAVFRPERWLEDADRAKVMDRHMFQVRVMRHLLTPPYLPVRPQPSPVLRVPERQRVPDANARCRLVAVWRRRSHLYRPQPRAP